MRLPAFSGLRRGSLSRQSPVCVGVVLLLVTMAMLLMLCTADQAEQFQLQHNLCEIDEGNGSGSAWCERVWLPKPRSVGGPLSRPSAGALALKVPEHRLSPGAASRLLVSVCLILCCSLLWVSCALLYVFSCGFFFPAYLSNSSILAVALSNSPCGPVVSHVFCASKTILAGSSLKPACSSCSLLCAGTRPTRFHVQHPCSRAPGAVCVHIHSGGTCSSSFLRFPASTRLLIMHASHFLSRTLSRTLSVVHAPCRQPSRSNHRVH
jgi:hypothetical protein